MQNFDLIVIGGGRASSLAVKAGKLGKKVALIEKSKLGGTCPNRGCVPSKLLIRYAHVARAIEESSRHFIDANINHIDVERIFKETNDYIHSIDPAYESRHNENVTLFRGEASFLSNDTVTVNDEELSAKTIVIATGTRPIEAPHKKAWTSDDIFPFEGNIPKSIAIVGSGFIACELANFFAAVGIKTKLLVRSQNLLAKEDKDISKIFKEEFTKNVDVVFDTSIKDISYKNEMFSLNLINKNSDETQMETEALLYATGRVSNADILNLHNTDVKVNDKGYIESDEFMQTTAKGIYVLGDANGKYMLQHAAAYEVNHLYKTLFEDEKEAVDFKYMPHAVFSDPEIASVGPSEQELIKNGTKYVTSTTNWLASAKAMSTRLKYPRIKFIINPINYEIIACHIIGPDSATMIHQVLAVMHIENDIRHIKNMLYVHPAMSEALLPAAVKAVNEVEKYKDI